MYFKLIGEMFKSKITIRKLADFLGIDRNTMGKKLKGKAFLTVEEAQKIRDNFFPDIALDVLLQK